MKQFLILIVSSFLFSIASYAQSQPNIGCLDKSIKMQAVDLQLSFAKQNMTVYKDATVRLSSQEPFPIEVELKKGTLYQFVFIGSKDASKIKMELFDGADKKIADKTITPNSSNNNSNCIMYSFTPATNDLYLLMLSQKNKGSSKCTSFTIMQLNKDKKADSSNSK